MKKLLQSGLLVALVLIALVPGTACTRTGPSPGGEQAVMQAARETVAAMKAGDMARLSNLIHPSLGVRFSPYGYIHTDAGGDLILTGAKVRSAMTDSTVYHWGVYDGSGLPMDLTFAQYWKSFVYDRDFAAAPQVAYNRVIGQGNTMVNVKEAYPGCAFVEFHFPGTDANGGMDWDSLRLVYQFDGGRWYLVGVSHDQWTI